MLTLKNLRIIPYRKETGAFNMAADTYLMENSPIATLRFYGWKKPTLSLGKANLGLHDIDIDFCWQENFDFVIRPSGGKTVFHDKELTYCLSAPSKIFPAGILNSYKLISQSLIIALDNLGITSSMQPEKIIDTKSSNCFQEVSSWEINQFGKKIVGSAQLRKKDYCLQHGSIIIKLDYPKWAAIWKNLSITKLKKRMVGLNEINKKINNPKKLAEFLSVQLCKIWQTDYIISPLSKIERSQIQQKILNMPEIDALNAQRFINE